MATITAAYENSATIGTTPYSLPNNSTTLTPITVDGIYEVSLDLSAMTVTEEYKVQCLEKVRSAGTQRPYYTAIVRGAQSEDLVFPSRMLLHGWDVQVTKVAGTDRSIGWSIRQVAP